MTGQWAEEEVSGYSNNDHNWDGGITKVLNENRKRRIAELPEWLRQQREKAIDRSDNK